jgi:hypothetical protein
MRNAELTAIEDSSPEWLAAQSPPSVLTPKEVEARKAVISGELFKLRVAYPTQTRIIEWWRYYKEKIHISFSGGKDSTVLAYIAARVYEMLYQAYPDQPHTLNLVFADTGLEYPEIRAFVPKFADWLRETYGFPVNLEIVRPKRTFRQVIERFGYPVIGKEVAKYAYYAREGKQYALDRFNGVNKKTVRRQSFGSGIKSMNI